MKKCIVSVVAAFSAAVAAAADLFVPSDSWVTNFVAQGGSETFSGRLAVASDGVLAKTGAGTWTVPGATLCQYWPFTATVCEGTMALTAGGTAPANDVPAVLQNDAAVWVSMKDTDATHFVKDGDNLVKWYDVREADVSDQKRYSFEASFTYAPAGTYPQVTTHLGFPCVYFRGVGSGVAMSLRNSTGAANINSFHLFAVVCHTNTQGVVFGSGSSAGNMFMASTSSTGVDKTYAAQDRLWPSTMRGKTYVDGVRCDPYAEKPPAGRFHLFDTGSPVNGRFAALFGQWGAKTYWGGDYLAEAIVFTREISETERLQIESYLAQKWFPNASFARNVRVEEGAAARVDDFSGLTLSGEGSVIKTGAGATTYRTAPTATADETFNGGLTVEAGSVNLSSRLPLNVVAGTTVTAEKTADGQLGATTSSAAAGSLVKTGSGDVALTALPSGMTELKVEGGSLELDRGLTNKLADNDSFYVPIENPGFETYFTEAEWKAQATSGFYNMPSSTEYTNGWRRSVNQVWLMNWDVLSSANREKYNLTHRPHDGSVMALINQNGILATPVTIPKAGTYELSFDVGGREGNSYLGDYVKCTLHNGTADVANFGRGVFYEFGYRRISLRAKVTAAGSYELRFQDVNVANCPTIIDNVSLRYVSEREKAVQPWLVQNGGFECDSELLGADNRKYVTESPFANWSFDSGTDGLVAIVTAATTNGTDGAGTEYNSSRGTAGGFRQLLMKAGACSATVTFAPPATTGKYYLRADLGKYYRYYGTCTASVTVGSAAPLTLGTFDVVNSLMRTYTWEAPLEVTGSENIAITFSFARKQSMNSKDCGIWLDDVCLVPYDDRDFLVNGGFETSSKTLVNWADGWECLTNHPAAYAPIAQVQPYIYRPDVFSADPVEGRFFLYLQRTGGAARSVTFDHAGLYRLSFYTSFSRRGAEGDTNYNRPTPVRAWLANGAVTNEIGRTGGTLTTNYCQHVWNFRVAAPGTYKLGLQGTSDIKIGCNVCVDAVTIRRIDERVFAEGEDDPRFDETAKISVAAGARLRVDFAGTNKVEELRLGGRKVKGVIDAADYPDYLSGSGCFLVEPKGLMMIFR